MVKGNTKKELISSLPEQCFWVHDGPILSDMKELLSALKKDISNDQYLHHLEGGRNDFADWIEHTLGDRACAQELRKVKRKDTAVKKLEMCLKGYKSK